MWPDPAVAGGTCPPCGLLGQSRRSLGGRGECGARGGASDRSRENCEEAAGGARVRSGFAAQARPSPAERRGGLRKGQRRQEVAACRPEELTVPEFVCAAQILDCSLVDHVRHQQPRGGEEAAGEYAERFTGPVSGMQEEIPTCQRGKLWATSGEGTVSPSLLLDPVLHSQTPVLSNFHLVLTFPDLRVGGLYHRRVL